MALASDTIFSMERNKKTGLTAKRAGLGNGAILSQRQAMILLLSAAVYTALQQPIILPKTLILKI
jgi:hypothetical protein